MRHLVSIALAAVLTACATASNYPPEPVAGQADTARFKVYTMAGVPESHADKVIAPELDAYRAQRGYAGYQIVERRWSQIPTFFEYTVRFTR